MSKDLKELLASLVIILVLFLIIRTINRYCAKRIRENKINRLLLSRATMRSTITKASKRYRETEQRMLRDLEAASKEIFGHEVRGLLATISIAKDTNDLGTMGACQNRLNELATNMAEGRDVVLGKLKATYQASIIPAQQRIDEINKELKELEYRG